MKLKLAQRLMVKYYITQFKALALVSPRRAAEKAFDLFCTPLPVKKSRRLPPAFEKAERIQLHYEGITVRGYRWRPATPNGKKAMVLHGFSSQVFKFEKYIQPLLKAGFEVLMFDAPAHGLSDGKRINALLYKRILLAADRQFGPVYAMIGHSLGALAATLAFEELDHQDQRRLVLIAPATETETALRNFFHVIKVDEIVKTHFRELIRETAGKGIDYFSVNRAVRNISSRVLWVHDKHDRICPLKDIYPTMEARLPHISFHLTEQLGHNRIYKDSGVISTIVSFLTAG